MGVSVYIKRKYRHFHDQSPDRNTVKGKKPFKVIAAFPGGCGTRSWVERFVKEGRIAVATLVSVVKIIV